MDDLTIEDKNKLIAEFLEPGSVQDDWVDFRSLGIIPHLQNLTPSPEDLDFDSEWNWLMPVCKKFDELDLADEDYIKHCDNIDHCVTLYEIEPVYEAVVRAILWYNEFIK